MQQPLDSVGCAVSSFPHPLSVFLFSFFSLTPCCRARLAAKRRQKRKNKLRKIEYIGLGPKPPAGYISLFSPPSSLSFLFLSSSLGAADAGVAVYLRGEPGV